jgi:hypothetical protein
MPKKAIDYNKCIIYKIVSNDLTINDLYVGHTTNFTKRKQKHKSDCNNINSRSYNLKVYQFIRENGGWENWNMVLIENYPCNNELEALARERYFYELLNGTLNSQYPNRSVKEYYNDNKDKIKQYNKQYDKQYYIDNKDKIKQYREQNKDKIKECKRLYRQQNKDKIKQYYNDNKEHIKQYQKEYRLKKN